MNPKYLTLLVVPFLLLPFAHAQLEDAGFLSVLDFTTEHGTYEVSIISNLNLRDFEFDSDMGKLTLFVTRQVEDSLAEIVIPKGLLGEELTFHLNGQEFFPDVKPSSHAFFVVMNFTGLGESEIEIIGTDYARIMPEIDADNMQMTDGSTNSESNDVRGGGCLIATATFGSELSLQVQELREVRDNMLETESGNTFIHAFNTMYYSFSPSVADYARQNPAFKEAVKLSITPAIHVLSILNHVEINSEADALLYGGMTIAMLTGLHAIPLFVIVYLYRMSSMREIIMTKLISYRTRYK